MIVFPNSKINLGLKIIEKRPDGYHNIETVFYPIPLTDALEVLPHPPFDADPLITFTKSGISLDCDPSENLCIKAFRLLKKDFHNQLPRIKIHLHKSIPSGAGLGGGSADAAYTLILLNNQFQLGLSETELKEYAFRLGSDCPFFIVNKPCLASGRGEQLTEVDLLLNDYQIVIINPGIHINTGRAFLHSKPCNSSNIPLVEVLSQPIANWKHLLSNDFEKTVFVEHPTIGEIKQTLYNAGAIYASMSGSGSTIFGLFPKSQQLNFSFPDHYFIKQLALS